MIMGIDTNVLIRVVYEDEGAPAQCNAAKDLIYTAITKGSIIYPNC